MKKVEIYTVGKSIGSPGVGGWGTILKYNNYMKELHGGDLDTLYFRMKLLGVVKGLQELKEPCRVDVITDSRYINKAINHGLINIWKDYNFSNKNNADLWVILLQMRDFHSLKVRFSKKHMYYDLCERLADREISNINGNK